MPNTAQTPAADDSDALAIPDWSQEALAKRVPPTDTPRYYVKTRHVWNISRTQYLARVGGVFVDWRKRAAQKCAPHLRLRL